MAIGPSFSRGRAQSSATPTADPTSSAARRFIRSTGRCRSNSASCSERAFRATAGKNHPAAIHCGQARPVARWGDEPLRLPDRRVVLNDSCVARHQLPVGSQLGEHIEIAIIDRIRNEVANTLPGRGRDSLLQMCRAGTDQRMGKKANPGWRLPLQHANEIGIRHRRQRIVALRRVRDQLGPEKEMAVVDGATKRGRGGAKRSVVRARELHQHVRHGTDIAAVGGIECRTILEEDLTRATREQSPRRLPAPGNSFVSRDDARFLRNHDGGDVADRRKSSGSVTNAQSIPAAMSMAAVSIPPVRSSATPPKTGFMMPLHDFTPPRQH